MQQGQHANRAIGQSHCIDINTINRRRVFSRARWLMASEVYPGGSRHTSVTCIYQLDCQVGTQEQIGSNLLELDELKQLSNGEIRT